MNPTTVVNMYRHEYDLKITRGDYLNPNPWGNPHRLKRTGDYLDRIRCLLAHAEGLVGSDLLDRVHELRGKRIACVCAPLRCHGDTLARLADSDDPRAEIDLIVEELRAEVEDIERQRSAQFDMFGGGL